MQEFTGKPSRVRAAKYNGEPMTGVETDCGCPENTACGLCGRAFVITFQREKVPVNIGDWIVEEPNGQGFYPCADEVFRRKYTSAHAKPDDRAKFYKIGDLVIHSCDCAPFKVTGIAGNMIEIEGDWSGGTHNVCQRDWVSYDDIRPCDTNAKVPNIPMIPVDSSAVNAFGYDKNLKVLAVEYAKGGLYHYPNYSFADFEKLRRAESLGKFIIANIQKLPHVKIS